MDENGNKPCVGLCYLNKLQAIREGGEGAGHPMEVSGNVPVVVFLKRRTRTILFILKEHISKT